MPCLCAVLNSARRHALTTLVWGMMIFGLAVLVAGLILVRPRFQSASGPGRLIVLGPVFEAVSLAAFAAEHFFAARQLMDIVPRWLPAPLFWTYFVGVALMAAAISFIAWSCVRWSASLLAVLFLIIVVTVDLPNLPAHLHERLFWTLTARELVFACGAMVLAASTWPHENPVSSVFARLGRTLIAIIFVFYAVQHVLFPRFVPGVPLEKLTPPWIPAPAAISWFVGLTLLLAGPALLIRPAVRIAAAASGLVLLLLTAFFYVPIFVAEFHSPLAVEGLNYIYDTLLFAATALLAGKVASDAHKTANAQASEAGAASLS